MAQWQFPLWQSCCHAKSQPEPLEGTWYEAPRRAHSEKPELFMDLIEQMSYSPRIELFARRARLGWHAWGNEVSSDIELVDGPDGPRWV